MKKIITILLCVVMLAVGVNAAFEKVNTYSNNFSDVTDANWFYENVKTAYELGFMNGKAEGQFDPNGNVTVVEGLTMASRLHAAYKGTEVKVSENANAGYRIDFDDPGKVALAYNRVVGKLEDGNLVAQPDKPNASGAYDPQITIKGLGYYGQPQEYTFEDFDARVMCHEFDHLDGILYKDKAKEMYDASEEGYED